MNFLVPDVKGLNIPNPGVPDVSKQDLLTIDGIHRTYIFNESGTLSFQGFVPADFQISLQAEWGPIFPSMSASEIAAQVSGKPFGGIETLAQFLGGSTKAQALSAQAWQGPAYLQLSLPIQIDALVDTKREIIDKLVQISSFTTPTTSQAGMLIAPGPVPALAVTNSLAGVANLGGVQNMLSGVSADNIIYVQIGRFFRMSPCIVTNVVAAFSGQPEDVTSNPMSVEFNIELSSYFAVTREDILAWFRGNFGNPGGL